MSYDSQSIAGRSALLDAAISLEPHLDSLVLIGAQAIYLYTGDTDVAIATSTKDSDIAVLPGRLGGSPTLDDAMALAGFEPDLRGHQGTWVNADGVPVDLLVPEGAHEFGEKKPPRGARIAPHSKIAARYVKGIEGASVDNRLMSITALEPTDDRIIQMKVAGPAALVVAKTFKICERIEEVEDGKRDRRTNKDAHDLYRLLRKVDPSETAIGFSSLLSSEIGRDPALWALEALSKYGMRPESQICTQAGSAEAGIGDEEEVAESTAALIAEVVEFSSP